MISNKIPVHLTIRLHLTDKKQQIEQTICLQYNTEPCFAFYSKEKLCASDHLYITHHATKLLEKNEQRTEMTKQKFRLQFGEKTVLQFLVNSKFDTTKQQCSEHVCLLLMGLLTFSRYFTCYFLTEQASFTLQHLFKALYIHSDTAKPRELMVLSAILVSAIT